MSDHVVDQIGQIFGQESTCQGIIVHQCRLPLIRTVDDLVAKHFVPV